MAGSHYTATIQTCRIDFTHLCRLFATRRTAAAAVKGELQTMKEREKGALLVRDGRGTTKKAGDGRRTKSGGRNEWTAKSRLTTKHGIC